MIKAIALSLVIGAANAIANAQDSTISVPVVKSAEIPIYPDVPSSARIQGEVKVKVHTDGAVIVQMEAISGPPLLIKAVKENLSTWRFKQHSPQSFVVSFRYILEGETDCRFENSEVKIRFPFEVEIKSKAFNCPQRGY